jgi:serine/threonine protein kinase
VGCILYELLVGERPFGGDLSVFEYWRLRTPISTPKQAFDRFGVHWEDVFLASLQGTLSVDPESRPGISQVLRKCAFHYEFALIDNPTVYHSYRLQGCAYWDISHSLLGWYSGAYDSSYIYCTDVQLEPKSVLDAANGFRKTRCPQSCRIGIDRL